MTDKPKDKAPEELLGDLESIRTLLVEETDQDNASDVPLLDDIVDDVDIEAADEDIEAADKSVEQAQAGDGPLLSRRSAMASPLSSGSIGLDDDQIQSLLGNDWKSSATDALTSARETIENHSDDWSPQDTDELTEALRVRIDETIFHWTQKMMREHIDELREEVLKVFSDDLQQLIDERLKGEDGS